MSPGHAFNREILIDCAHEGFIRLGDDVVVSVVGNGPAIGEGRNSGASTASQQAVNPVPVQQGSGTPQAGEQNLWTEIQPPDRTEPLAIPGTDRRSGKAGTVGPHPILHRNRLPLAVGPTRPGANRVSSKRPGCPGVPPEGAPRSPTTRPGSGGTTGPWGLHPRCVPTARPVATTDQWNGVTQFGPPGPPRRCLFQVPGTPWPHILSPARS